MKNLFPFLLCLAALAACAKATPESDSSNKEILFRVSTDMPLDVSTKVPEDVTSLSRFRLMATSVNPNDGKDDRVTGYDGGVEFTGSDGTYSGNKYWPNSDEHYRFYASNTNNISYSVGGPSILANNETDVVCAYLPEPEFQKKNTLTFSHIFARIGDVSVTAVDGYTISEVSLSITPLWKGTYNLRTGYGHTDGTGWSSTEADSSTNIANSTPGTKNNVRYLVPGTYTVTAGWKAVKGNYTRVYSGVTTDVFFESGKITGLNVTLGGNATDIAFDISVSEWDAAVLTPEFSAE